MPQTVRQSVVVTGASSGIGFAITRKLAKAQYNVISTARVDEDIERLSKIKNVQGIKLDVRNQHDIKRLRDQIQEEGTLFALINNAGVSDRGALLDLTSDILKEHLDINLFGPHRLIKSLFPFLKESAGRIINVSSLSGVIIPPFRGGYNLSKWGLEVYSEQLNLELTDYNIKVSLIEPGIVSTDIFEKINTIYDKHIAESQFFKKHLIESKKGLSSWTERHRKSPEVVADRVIECLTSKNPKLHYVVCDKEEQNLVIPLLLQRLIDIVNGFPFELTRGEIIDILSKELD